MKNHHTSHTNNHRNKIARRLLKYALLACTASALLAGCGQRGALYLPTAPEAAQRSTIVDTLTKPASASSPASPAPQTSPTTTPATTPAPAK